MKHFVKLVNFEINRFAKVYWSLILITVLSQFFAIVWQVYTYLRKANAVIYNDSLTKIDYIKQYGQISFMDCLKNIWFLGPIALCAAAIMFYIFLIWYRDWFGKYAFVYRLLMLPAERIMLIIAKAGSILMMVIGLVAFQLFLLPFEQMFFKMIMPAVYRSNLSIIEAVQRFDYLNLLLPNTFIDFILYYGLGITAVLVVFTAIMLERSYHIKGLFAGILYGIISLAVFFSPFIVESLWFPDYLYPIELLWIEIVIGLLIAVCSIVISGYLIRNKVTV